MKQIAISIVLIGLDNANQSPAQQEAIKQKIHRSPWLAGVLDKHKNKGGVEAKIIITVDPRCQDGLCIGCEKLHCPQHPIQSTPMLLSPLPRIGDLLDLMDQSPFSYFCDTPSCTTRHPVMQYELAKFIYSHRKEYGYCDGGCGGGHGGGSKGDTGKK